MNPDLSFISSRKNPDLAVLEGFHAVKHALRFGADLIPIVLEEGVELDFDIFERAQILNQARVATRSDFQKLSPSPHPTGVMAIAKRRHWSKDDFNDSKPLVVLDHPRSPHNVGAVIRVAAAADVAGVIVLGRIDPWLPEVIRGAAGLQFAIPVLREEELNLSERPLMAIDPEGELLGEAALPANSVLIFGSERHGISDQLLKLADKRLRLPMREGVSSLNLATSVAATLYAANWTTVE